MPVTEAQQPSSELEQRLVDRGPVVPRDLVVLAIRVVVSPLRPADLIAPKQHGHALRQHQRREKVTLLTGSQCVDVGILRGTFGSAIPRSIVTLSITTVFPVCLVMLFVVRDEVAKRQSIVRRNEVDAGIWAPSRPLIQI